MSEKITGVFAAIVTPLTDDNLDRAAAERQSDRLLEAGVQGFYVCGSSGESLLLSPDERMEMLEVTLNRVNGRAKVIAHVGCLNTRETIALAKHAASAGCGAISAIPPVYFQYGFGEITQFYLDVAEAAGLPLLIYNIPHMTGVSFTPENVRPLFGHPLIAGMKDTSPDLYQMRQFVERYPDKTIISGFDELMLPAMSVGVRCAIGSFVNFMPQVHLKLRAAFLAGDMCGAMAQQDKINRACEVLQRIGVFRGIKAILKLQGYDCGVCRKPFLPLNGREEDELRELLTEIA
jgi:N-acetylneuraminate lyase